LLDNDVIETHIQSQLGPYFLTINPIYSLVWCELRKAWGKLCNKLNVLAIYLMCTTKCEFRSTGNKYTHTHTHTHTV